LPWPSVERTVRERRDADRELYAEPRELIVRRRRVVRGEPLRVLFDVANPLLDPHERAHRREIARVALVRFAERRLSASQASELVVFVALLRVEVVRTAARVDASNLVHRAPLAVMPLSSNGGCEALREKFGGASSSNASTYTTPRGCDVQVRSDSCEADEQPGASSQAVMISLVPE
jgi:hypothetical protein